MFYKKDVFKQLANFTEKIYVGVSFLIKLQTSGLQQNVSYKDRMKPYFFVTFNIIISHIFSENFIEIPQVVLKI